MEQKNKQFIVNLFNKYNHIIKTFSPLIYNILQFTVSLPKGSIVESSCWKWSSYNALQWMHIQIVCVCVFRCFMATYSVIYVNRNGTWRLSCRFWWRMSGSVYARHFSVWFIMPLNPWVKMTISHALHAKWYMLYPMCVAAYSPTGETGTEGLWNACTPPPPP